MPRDFPATAMVSSLLRSAPLRSTRYPLLRRPCPLPRPASTLHTNFIGTTSLTRTAVVVGRGRAGMVTVTKTKAPSPTDQSTAGSPHVTIDTSSPAPPPSADITDQPNVDGVVVTGSCAEQIRLLASKRPDSDNVYLRVYVDAGGCSGFQYKFELESDATTGNGDEDEGQGIDPEDDVIFAKDGARVVIDRTSLDFVRGSTIDYVREMIRSSFAVANNPLSESACGCGSSFALKNFEENPAID